MKHMQLSMNTWPHDPGRRTWSVDAPTCGSWAPSQLHQLVSAGFGSASVGHVSHCATSKQEAKQNTPYFVGMVEIRCIELNFAFKCELHSF